ncbi:MULTISPECIES: S66 peptidase family protein [Allobacillus]|uniref:LD-carboxypeptidase n=1 Tax=Allobacillus halotolerans TaxID=570278 RepID=A0ABS6GLW9_9BACI|nr:MULTISPECIES: LD-carboxypeptidase [Allobacillus]MBU6080083.1 LD-carboxypeptidase [Allobacillus halotolerans]TSJ65566.1 LD-carboxypeptidase [Allobacillus sp. SKP2-8]
MLPKPLKHGDTVGVIAPASPPNIENYKKSIAFIESFGLSIQEGKHLKNVHGYLAGTDDERLEDLHDMFADDSIKGIIFAGGGYGTARIAHRLDYELIKKNPKIFWGYSDLTYLHTAIRQETGLVTFHGPMLASDVGKEDFHPLSKKQFNQLFEPTFLVYDESIAPLEVIAEGKAEGEIVGGNLTLIASSLGGQYELDTKGKLLLIEDVDEEPYRIDGYLAQLMHAGKLEEAAGIIVGDFNNAVPTRNPSLSLETVLDDYFRQLGKPVMKGFQIGHCQPHFAIPLGTRARLSTESKTLTIQPGVTGSSNDSESRL